MGNNKEFTCKSCNVVFPVLDGIPFAMADRGGRNAYLCRRCADKRGNEFSRMGGYTDENDTRRGKDKVKPHTFAIENETKFPTAYARCVLERYDFMATHDCTVHAEFKSPIYNGMGALIHILPTLEKLKASGDITVDCDCGTHLHVGHRDLLKADGRGQALLQRQYYNIFGALSDAIDADGGGAALFGRPIGHGDEWANTINRTTPADKHENFVNVQHAVTIELRQCKFISAEQYARCIHFADDLMKIIADNYLSKISFYTSDADAEKLAKKTGEKLVKKYRKYSAAAHGFPQI